MPDTPQIEATRRSELLVAHWHSTNKRFLGQGGGVDWQARKALVLDVAAALTGLLAEIEALRADAAGSAKPARSKKASEA